MKLIKEMQAKAKTSACIKYCKNGNYSAAFSKRPWQFLYFLPLPQGQGSLRPTFFSTRMGWVTCFCCVSLCDCASRSCLCSRIFDLSMPCGPRDSRTAFGSCVGMSARIRKEMTSSLMFSNMALNRLNDSSL